jgi:DNA-binding NarL/FixJ family response regulator
MNPIKILVAHDYPLIAEGLKNILGPSVEVLNIAADLEQLLKTAQQLNPDIIVLTSKPSLNGLKAMKQFLSSGFAAKFVVLTIHADPVYAAKAIRSGASAFVLKQSSVGEIHLAFNEVIAGRTYIASEIVKDVTEILMGKPEGPNVEQRLRPRQLEVLRLFAEGFSAKEVASILFISKRTADNHKASIKRVLGVKSTAELVKLAIRFGLVNSQ